MKLVIAIVQDADAHRLQEQLSAQGFTSTKLASSGGFLREGNTTLMTGVEDKEVAYVKAVIAKTCHKRQKLIRSMPIFAELHDVSHMPLDVTVGGAVVFVLNIDEFVTL